MAEKKPICNYSGEMKELQNGDNIVDSGAERTSNKGAANGYAELDENVRVPSSQLPSYVDDIIEVANFAALPATGETGKIYVTLNDNLTFRWSGTAYTEVSPSLALGETSATAYRGDRGKTAYDHSQATHAPADAQKNSDITKAEIEDKLTGEISSHTHAGGSTFLSHKFTAAGTWSPITGLSAEEIVQVTVGMEAANGQMSIEVDGDVGKVVSDSFAGVFNPSSSLSVKAIDNAAPITSGSYENYILISSLSTNSSDIYIKPDGTRIYIIDIVNIAVYEYHLSTAWDISTASYQYAKSISGYHATGSHGLFFSPDGTKMFTCGGNEYVVQWTLSTPWSITSATFSEGKDVSGQVSSTPMSMCFSADGLAMYLLASNNIVYQYNLSTAWTVSTATYANKYKDLSSEVSTAIAIHIDDDGERFFCVSMGTSDYIFEYSMSTPKDVSTIVYGSLSYDVTSQENAPRGITFKSDYTKFYLCGVGTNRIKQFSCINAFSGTALVAVTY